MVCMGMERDHDNRFFRAARQEMIGIVNQIIVNPICFSLCVLRLLFCAAAGHSQPFRALYPAGGILMKSSSLR